MSFEFNPNNPVIQRCLQGMMMVERGNDPEAEEQFQSAWREAVNDFEKFYAAYFLGQHQQDNSNQLKWLDIALQLALKIDNVSVASALPTLFSKIAKCYEALGAADRARQIDDLASEHIQNTREQGPFYHGTKADLQLGDLLTAGEISNYQAELKMNHIYFTANPYGAGLAAALAKGEGKERVYIVEPTGAFENDPNVTDKKFPGNPTRSYRSKEPLRIVGELADWTKQTPEQLSEWRERLANNKGEIIN